MFLVVALYSQLLDLHMYINQSAITPEDTIQLRLLLSSFLSTGSFEAVTLVENEQSITGFDAANSFEKKALVSVSSSQMNQVGFRLENPSFNTLIPWRIEGSTAPVNSHFIRAGDYPSFGGNTAVDMRSASFALTQSSFWVALENRSGSYTSNALNMNMYGTLLINIDQFSTLGIDIENFNPQTIGVDILNQLDAFAIIHANVNLVVVNIQPGLYKFPLSALASPSTIAVSVLQTMTPVGSISSTVSGNTLMMGVDYETLSQATGFGQMPNSSGALLTIPFMLRISGTNVTYNGGASTLVFTNPYQILPQSVSLPEVSILSNVGSVVRVNYAQPSGFYPIVARYENTEGLIIEGVSSSLGFTENAVFSFTRTHDMGTGQFTFSSDNANFVNLSFDSSVADMVMASGTQLMGNYPNPFNPHTSVAFSVGQDSIFGSHVIITIYNIKGQRVRTLVDEVYMPGDYNVVWDAQDDNSREVRSGVYLYRMSTGGYEEVRRMVLLK
jgi:hypothetical protein